MQSCQVPLLVRKCLRPLIHLDSKSSGHPLLGFSVPSRPPPSRDLLLRSLSDELSESEEESLDESKLVASEESLDELVSSDEYVGPLRPLATLLFSALLLLFRPLLGFGFCFLPLLPLSLFLVFGLVLQQASTVLV